MIKYCLEEDENLEDYDIQESNLEEIVDQVKRPKLPQKYASNSKWPKFEFAKEKSYLVKKEAIQNKAKKRRSLSYITNVLPIIENDEKFSDKFVHKTGDTENLLLDSKVNDEFQIDDSVIESIPNVQPENTLVVKTFKRINATQATGSKSSKLNRKNKFKHNLSQVSETASQVVESASQVEVVRSIFKNNSKWLMVQNKRMEKKFSKTSKQWQRLLNSCLENDQSLTFQLKTLIDRDQLEKSAWLHSTTSQLKNKITENNSNRDHILIQLSKIESAFGLTFADGKLIESSKLDYVKGDLLKLSFPQGLAEDMGLSNMSTIKLTWPWKMIKVDRQKFILNPFWIDVITRSNQESDTNIEDIEEIIFTFKCDCRDPLNSIDPLECNKLCHKL